MGRRGNHDQPLAAPDGDDLGEPGHHDIGPEQLNTVLTRDATGTTRNGTGSGRDVLIAQIEAGNKDHARLLHRQ